MWKATDGMITDPRLTPQQRIDAECARRGKGGY
jgi:hypothetical protein